MIGLLPEDVKYSILGFADLPKRMIRLVSKRADIMVCNAIPTGTTLRVYVVLSDDANNEFLGDVRRFLKKCPNLSKDVYDLKRVNEFVCRGYELLPPGYDSDDEEVFCCEKCLSHWTCKCIDEEEEEFERRYLLKLVEEEYQGLPELDDLHDYRIPGFLDHHAIRHRCEVSNVYCLVDVERLRNDACRARHRELTLRAKARASHLKPSEKHTERKQKPGNRQDKRFHGNIAV